jgi:hypothetical protein
MRSKAVERVKTASESLVLLEAISSSVVVDGEIFPSLFSRVSSFSPRRRRKQEKRTVRKLLVWLHAYPGNEDVNSSPCFVLLSDSSSSKRCSSPSSFQAISSSLERGEDVYCHMSTTQRMH